MTTPHPSSDTLERLEKAEELKLQGDNTAALEILETLIMEDPSNVSALEEIADNELSLHQFTRAEAAAKRAVELDNLSYTGHYILGYIYSHREKWEQALEHLELANRKRGNNPEILRCLGWALFNSGKRTQGVVTLERALNLDSSNPLTLCDLGVAYLKAQNFPKAKTLFSRTLDLDPYNSRARECVQAVEKLEQSMKERK
jgi:tetratricopeptide (TPR) repeat protein